jgi:hypothetical protein
LLFGSLIYAFRAILKYSESAMQINIMTSWHKYAVHAVLPDSTIYCREYPPEITYSCAFNRGENGEEVVNNEGEIVRSHFECFLKIKIKITFYLQLVMFLLCVCFISFSEWC